MKFIPDAIGRKVATQVLLGKKHSPTLLLGAGVVSMVGSTVMACRATLKLEEVLERAHHDLHTADQVRETHSDKYSESDRKKDTAIIYARSVTSVAKLYAPSVALGALGIVCLTKSHNILQDRNTGLSAAYIAVDQAFKNYRARVRDRYGDDVDRDLRYSSEEIEIVDDETGKVITTTRVGNDDTTMYARYFDEQNRNWNDPMYGEYNWVFLRNNQNWANDMLRARGYMFLNEVYSMLGLDQTSAGSIVGWVYSKDNPVGDNRIDFGCWDQQDGQPVDFFNGRNGAILLDFNVDGPIWDMVDAINASKSS